MLISTLATTTLAEQTCKDRATEKNLAGAAMTSFMKKWESDAAAACDKKLSGAAKTNFTTKCVKDASGN
jgi:hypothetical protein